MAVQKFMIGDVVRYRRKNSPWWTEGEIHIISEVVHYGKGYFRYATNKGAWFEGEAFMLLEKASRKSLIRLIRELLADEEE